MTVLDMEHACVRLNGFKLDVTMKIEEGMITGLIGRNGSGKSTTFKSVLGLTNATGTIKVFGKDCSKLTEKDKSDIGICYTDAFFPELFKLGNVRAILKGSYENFDGDEFDRLTEELDIPKDIKIANLSTGELAKLRVISAITHKAKLLILDEPTAGLDVVSRDSILGMLRGYMERYPDTAMVISSHISTDIESLCDEIYLIEDGRIIMHEDNDVIINDYGLIKCSDEDFGKIDKEYIICFTDAEYGKDVLVSQKRYYMENYPSLVIENGSIDKCLMLMTSGGVKGEIR